MIDKEVANRAWAMEKLSRLPIALGAPALFYANKVVPFGEPQKLAAYFERLKARPSFARVLKEAEPYFAMFPATNNSAFYVGGRKPARLSFGRSGSGPRPAEKIKTESDHAIHDADDPEGYETAAPGTMPPAEAVAAMMKYNEALKEAGVLITLDGLHPPSMGARVSFAGGKPVVTDGPFAEAKEVLGGYWMIDVKSREEAIAWAKRCPASSNEIIEIRQVQEMSDFPADVQEAAAGFAELQGRKN